MGSQNEFIQKTQTEDVRTALQENANFTFKCTGCGNCCQGPGDVYFSKQDFENISAHLKLDAKEKSKLYKRIIQSTKNGYLVHSAGTACYFLDEKNECKVYPVRPLQCRTFPFWPSTFRSHEDLLDVSSDSPGTMSTKEDVQSYTPKQVARKVNQTQKYFLEEQESEVDYFML